MHAVTETPLMILETIPDAYVRLDAESRFTFVNQAAERHLGKDRTRLLGKRFQEVFPGKRAERAVRNALHKPDVSTFELYSVKRGKWCVFTAVPDPAGGIVIRLADSAEPKSRHGDSQSRLNAIAQNLPGFVYQTYVRDNGEVGVSFADQRAKDIFGIDPEPLETVFKRFAACIAPEDQQRFKAAIREATLSTGQLDFEGKFITPAGEEKYIKAVSRARRLGDETLHDGIVLDVTEHVRMEQALRESEELYRQIFEVESDALLFVDNQSGRILAANAAAEDLYGYSRREMLSMNRVHFSAEPEATLLSTRLKTQFTPLRWHRKKDGTIFPVEISGRYFEWRGRPVFVSAIRDITGRVQMEEALKKSQEKFSKAFYSNPAAMLIGDRSNRTFLEVNDAFVRMMGYGREELVGRPSDSFPFWVDPSDQDKLRAQLARDGVLRDFEVRFRKKNGETGTGLLSVELIGIEGRPCAIASIIDVTERLQLEGQLRQAQKLESLGRLAGGVAHDFNNLLTVISGYSDMILRTLGPRDSLYFPAEAIKKAGERAAALTHQLLAFSRKQVIKPRLLDVNAIVADSERMLHRLIGEDIELTTRLDPSVGKVMADPDQISQVIVNLVVNARDAMPEGGALEITTRRVSVDGSYIATQGEAVPGEYALITVTDTGIGMDEKTLQSAFEPFFTTKEPGKGTGLGLSTVHGIVRQSDGWIQVRTEVGKGSSFDIFLPRIDAVPVAERVAPVSAEVAQGGETVLVVEDDDEVRRLSTTILMAQGYHVLEAANSDEALLLEKEYTGEIHLVLTDLVLPGMNGKALYERLRALRPKLKVLFTSGYTPDVFARRGLEPHVAYIPKPFDTESLTAKVREVLTEKQAGGDHS
jgi:two-component system cell cycle sensor histidine kinase/response regulator CckA